jgi:hypothetical protein
MWSETAPIARLFPKRDASFRRSHIGLEVIKVPNLPRPAVLANALVIRKSYLSSDTTHSTMTAMRQALPASSSAIRASFGMASPRIQCVFSSLFPHRFRRKPGGRKYITNFLLRCHDQRPG